MARYLKELSPVITHHNHKDFPLTDATLADPTSDNPIVEGEWVAIDTDGAHVVRALDDADWVEGGELTSFTAGPCYIVIAGSPRADVQVTKKVTTKFESDKEFETKIFDGAYSDYVPGDFLVVGSILIDGKTKAGLKHAPDREDRVYRAVVLTPLTEGWLRVQTISPDHVTV